MVHGASGTLIIIIIFFFFVMLPFVSNVINVLQLGIWIRSWRLQEKLGRRPWMSITYVEIACLTYHPGPKALLSRCVLDNTLMLAILIVEPFTIIRHHRTP